MGRIRLIRVKRGLLWAIAAGVLTVLGGVFAVRAWSTDGQGNPGSKDIRPFALAGGRAVATWNISGGQVVLAPFAPLGTQTQTALAADAADVMRFLGE